MAYAHSARSSRPNWAEAARRAEPDAAVAFTWSRAKIRTAALVLAGSAVPAMAGMSVPVLRWICLAWLLGVAAMLHGLGRRAADRAIVVAVDRHGILDRRLLPTHIRWQDIAAICPVDVNRAQVVDIGLRWPRATLAAAAWPVRIGAAVQTGYGIPAVTVSMLLLEGSVSDLVAAVARYRPDLLSGRNRAPPSLGGVCTPGAEAAG